MLTAEQLRLALSSEAELREHRVPHDIQLELTGTGNSLHAMASTADGRIVVVQGEGSFNNSTLHQLTADVLSKIISALNPFTRKDPYTGLECGVHVTRIEGGMAKLGPLVMVTDKMQIVGRGEIDLATEKLDLAWTAKPRKGVGLSASTFTNPYVKLGGTLTEPRVTVKPLQAAAATTAAVTTGGLSILAKGFWDRVTSGKKACQRAKKKAGIE